MKKVLLAAIFILFCSVSFADVRVNVYLFDANTGGVITTKTTLIAGDLIFTNTGAAPVVLPAFGFYQLNISSYPPKPTAQITMANYWEYGKNVYNQFQDRTLYGKYGAVNNTYRIGLPAYSSTEVPLGYFDINYAGYKNKFLIGQYEYSISTANGDPKNPNHTSLNFDTLVVSN